MTVTMNLETRQRAFTEWWSEETEYLFQRIEHWAACAKGYNRLRSQKIPRSQTTMKEENSSSLSSRWSIAGNKLFIEESSFNPRLQPLNRSHARQLQHEELKLNCCGTLNYRSNGKLDSNCLETYSYDHSIYFKTIGDLKKSRDSSPAKLEKNHCERRDSESINDEFEHYSRINNPDENANYEEEQEKGENSNKIGKYQQVASDEIWPGVLVTYRKNIDPTSSPHRYVESVSGSDCYFLPGI